MPARSNATIEVLVSRIRRKIEPDPQNASIIKTVRSGVTCSRPGWKRSQGSKRSQPREQLIMQLLS